MDFLKKHYEKVLLGVMLAGLIGGLVFMLFYIRNDTEKMSEKRLGYINPPVKDLPALDTTALDAAKGRAGQPYNLNLETTNKLFNPMEWQKALDGTLILAAKKTGPEVAVVTGITPLYTIVSLDSVITNEVATNYLIQVEREAASTPVKRHPTRHYLSLGEKPNSSDPFVLREIKGPADNPTGVVLKMTDMEEPITISKDHPYRRVDGYAGDFRYDPEKKVFRGKRTGDRVSFGGTDYTVVDVGQNELILMDQSNQKKTTLSFVP